MTGAALQAWRARLKWSKAKAASELGIGRNTYARHEDAAAVPRHIALACAALAYGLKPMGEALELRDYIDAEVLAVMDAAKGSDT